MWETIDQKLVDRLNIFFTIINQPKNFNILVGIGIIIVAGIRYSCVSISKSIVISTYVMGSDNTSWNFNWN